MHLINVSVPTTGRLSRTFRKVSHSLQRRPLIAALVLSLHILLVYVIVAGLKLQVDHKPEPEMLVTLSSGGPRIVRGVATKPTLVMPEEPLVPPPEIVAEERPVDSILVASATGGDGVTVPAEAIGSTRSVPALSPDLLAIARRAALRLRLTIAADGSVFDAVVENSTGSSAVDQMAVAWVKAHWRYRPAMRNGLPISVATTSLVPF